MTTTTFTMITRRRGGIRRACLLGAAALALGGCAATPAGPGEPAKMRYFGGIKQPMYPEQATNSEQTYPEQAPSRR